MSEIEYVGDVAMWRNNPPKGPRDPGEEGFLQGHLDFPNKIVMRADDVINLMMPVAHRPKTCLLLLKDQLERPEIPDALELAIGLVALQRLAYRYVTEVGL